MIRHRLVVVGTAVAAAVCAVVNLGCGSGDPLPAPARAQQVRAECPVPMRAEDYLPAGVLAAKDAGMDALVRRFYGEAFLQRASEPPLWCGRVPGETYRLTGVTEGGLAVIRITRAEIGSQLIAVFFHGPPSRALRIRRRVERHLSEDEWSSAADALEKARIWQLLDGRPTEFVWALEMRRGDAYHILGPSRWFDAGPEGVLREPSAEALRRAEKALVQLAATPENEVAASQ